MTAPGNFFNVSSSCRCSKANPIPIQRPDRAEDTFQRVVDLVKMKAILGRAVRG